MTVLSRLQRYVLDSRYLGLRPGYHSSQLRCCPLHHGPNRVINYPLGSNSIAPFEDEDDDENEDDFARLNLRQLRSLDGVIPGC